MNITKASNTLETVNANNRNLNAGDLDVINDEYARFRRLFKGARVTVEIHGGAVPNSYRGRAASTWATRTRDGFTVERKDAPKRSHCVCWEIRVTVAKEGVEKKDVSGFAAPRREHGALVYRA